MDFREFVRFLRRYLWLLIGCVVVGVAAAVVLVITLPKSYTADSEVLFSSASTGTGQDLAFSQQYVTLRMPTYAGLTHSRAVLQAVIDADHLRTTPATLSADISTSQAANTTLLTISVSRPSAKQAQQVSLGVAQALINIATSPAANPQSAVVASVVGSPELPSSASSPSPKLFGVAGVFLGLVVGLLVGLAHWLRERWRDNPTPVGTAAATAFTPAPLVPAAPFVPAAPRHGVPPATAPSAPTHAATPPTTATPGRRVGRRRRGESA